MKGVVLSKTTLPIVDIDHRFPRGDIRTAAFWLSEILPYFPPAVHVIVIDPGVGTDRRSIVIRADDHILVGPDNGVLVPPAKALVSEISDEDSREALDIYTVDDETADSDTFHGRDVFAPIGGDIAARNGRDLQSHQGLTSADEITWFNLPKATPSKEGVTGEVLVVDDFGNVITNVPGAFIQGREDIIVNGESVPVGTTFDDVSVGQRLALVGSHGNVELDVNDGRGTDAFDLMPGDDVTLR